MAWTVPLPPPPDGWFYSRCSSVETLFRRVAYGGRKGRSAARRIKRFGYYAPGSVLCCVVPVVPPP